MIYIVLTRTEQSTEHLNTRRAFMSLDDAKRAVESGDIPVYQTDATLHIVSINTATGEMAWAYDYHARGSRWVDPCYN